MAGSWEPKLGDPSSISPEVVGAGAAIIMAIATAITRYIKERLNRTPDPLRGIATLIGQQQREIDRLTRENEQLHDRVHHLSYLLARAGIDPTKEATNEGLGKSELRRPDRGPGDGEPTGD